MDDKNNRHIIDILFVISLFSMFVISAIFLISIGANIYSKTMSHMDTNFSSRTAVAYVIEKIHQSDSEGNVTVTDFDGCDAIEITSFAGGKEYKTYIYEYNKSLMELTVRADIVLSKEAGQTILPVEEFRIEKTDSNLIKCSVSINQNSDENYSFNICTHTVSGNNNLSEDVNKSKGGLVDSE